MQNSPINIAVLASTVREQRRSIHAARFVASIGESLEGVNIRFVDPGDFHFPGDGNDPEGKDPRYTEITVWADAFFIVTPEYNHSFPGTLKRMIDSELEIYTHKPVAIAGVSDGNWGGTRAVEALLAPLRTMGFVATFSNLYFPRVQDLFNDEGEYLGDFHQKAVRDAYTELIWMARVLKYGRENLPNKYHKDKPY